jgi:effector-binding domain-containing protein
MKALEMKYGRSPRIMAAALELKGSYAGIGKAFLELKGLMDAGGIEQAGKPFALFYDNPTEKQAADLVSEVCIPVSREFESMGRFRFKVLEAAEVAETRHTGTPESYTETYGLFLESLLKEGFRLAGPTREFFESPSAEAAPGRGFLIQQPVKKS